MQIRAAILTLLTSVLFLVPGTSQARWLNVNTGRFQTMDSYEGSPSKPSSLHKYLYVQANPVNRADPSGFHTLAEEEEASTESVGLNVIEQMALREFTRRSAQTLAFKVGAYSALTLAGVSTVGPGVYFLAGPDVQQFTEVEQARIRVRARIEEEQRRQPGQILFHYTTWASAINIARSGLIDASESFSAGSLTFPSGVYATDIPPWNTDYTQRQLSALFYGGIEHHRVDSFVALRADDFFSLEHIGHPHQWVKPADEDDIVPVQVITHGSNLMSP